jgi:hypothetical protein
VRAAVFVDVLSHWCLAAMDAVDALADLRVPVEIVIAPVAGGKAVGFSHDLEAWFYRRGTRAYGRELRCDWCEGEQTATRHANAAVLAGADVCGDLVGTLRAVMRGAMEEGRLFGRPDEVQGFVAAFAGTTVEDIARRCADPAMDARLHEGNRRLNELGADERPTFRISNDAGDFALLKGVWQRDAVVACAQALASDERAYAEAGPPPL